MSRSAIRWLAGLGGVSLILVGILLAQAPAGWSVVASRTAGSLRFEDRSGALLREVPIGGSRARWIALRELPPWVASAVVAAEDHRFACHPGVDPLAIVRAFRDNRRAGRIVSGASTITMQVVRLASGRPPGGSRADKLAEALDALRLEQRLDKDLILEQYLNRAPFGRGTAGIEAASLTWFGHSARTLTPAEATWLAVLPRAPERLSRVDHREELEQRRRLLAARLEATASNRPTPADNPWRAALDPPLVLPRPTPPFEAPHLTSWLLDELPVDIRSRAGTIVTTLDHPLQAEIERRLRPRLERLAEKGARQAAVVVMDNSTRRLAVLLGSVDFFDPEAGQVNGALARRQPGSTLKPFTYALAFESGMTPATLVNDDPHDFAASGGPFAPRNYGGVSFGRVRIRDALAGSLNIAAVDALAHVGADRLFSRLNAMGLLDGRQAADDPGLGLTLGVAEVRLVDLANSYVTLARGGRHAPPVVVTAVRDAAGRRMTLPAAPPERPVIDPLAAWWVADILADDDARLRSFGRNGVLDMPWPVSVKTGTSSDWRDNWAVGFTREWTVAVWVGDFSGAPMHQVSGVFGAAPLLREIFGLLAARGSLTEPVRPKGLDAVVCCLESGDEGTPACPGTLVEWLPADRRPPACTRHGASADGTTADPALREGSANGSVGDAPSSTRFALRRPISGDIFFLDPALPRATQAVSFRAEAPAGAEVAWFLDGRPLGTTHAPHERLWRLAPGRHQLIVRIGESERSAAFEVRAGETRPRAAGNAAAAARGADSSEEAVFQ
ncbi:MAG TPA: penicillin-binding protein 1C [Candidatus Eisenbacteria bacterium]